MLSKVLPIPSARFAYSCISYYYDLTHSYDSVIYLGVVGEFTSQRKRGLVLIARRVLLPDDEIRMEILGAKLLKNPFDYLWKESLNKWESTSAGSALSALSAYHATSLCFEKQIETPVPRDLINSNHDSQIAQFMIQEVTHIFSEKTGNVPYTREQLCLDRAA